MPDQQREVRRARSLLMTFGHAAPQICNFLQNRSFECDAQTVGILAHCGDWQSIAAIAARYPQYDEESVVDAVWQLVGHGGLVARGSAEAERDEEYARSWEWREPAGFQHFGSRDLRFYDGQQTVSFVESRRATRPSPPLYETNEGLTPVHQLERLDGVTRFST